MQKLLMTALTAAGLACSVPATAATETFDFSGSCLNCSDPGVATGQIVLRNYSYGERITGFNFVSFHFDGSSDVSPFDILSGPQTSVSGQLFEDKTGSLNLDDPTNGLLVVRSGFWQAGPDDGTSAFGRSNSFSRQAAVSAAPEPDAWVLMITGVGIAGFALRRYRTTISYA